MFHRRRPRIDPAILALQEARLLLLEEVVTRARQALLAPNKTAPMRVKAALVTLDEASSEASERLA